MDKTSLLYYNNGTPQLIDVEIPTPMAEGVIIIICYLISVGYNLLIIISVLHNYNLRSSSFHVLLMDVCITCFLDCLTNESIAFVFLFNNDTDCCTFSAAVFHLFLLSHSFSLGLLLLERDLSLKDHLLSVRVATLGALASWGFSFVFVSPTFGFFEVHYFSNRNACSAVKADKWFPVFSLLVFLVLWSLIAISMYKLMCYIKKNHSDRQQLDIFSIFPSSNEFPNPVLPITLCSKIKTTCTVVFLYIVLVLPITISFSVTLFLSPSLEPNPWIDPRVVNDETPSVSTNPLEPLLIYSRYMYNALVPIIVLSTEKEIRLQSRLVFCSKRNAITNFDQSVDCSKTTNQQRTPETVYLCGRGTPVLFATSRGLYLRSSQNNQARYRDSVNDSKSKLRLLATFCDLTVNSSHADMSQTVRIGEGHSKDKRCVRFPSQVDAISAPGSRSSVWNSKDNSCGSNTQTITNPVFVKGESQPSTVGYTYSKM